MTQRHPATRHPFHPNRFLIVIPCVLIYWVFYSSFSLLRSSNMRILQVKKFPIYDIFTGSGWLNWSRVLLDKKKQITLIAGAPIVIIAPEQTLPAMAKLSRESNKAVRPLANSHNQQVYHANKS